MIKAGNKFDFPFIYLENKVQLVLKCKTKKDVPKVIEKLEKLCLPLRMKFVDNAYWPNNQQMPVAAIPKELTKMDEIASWMISNCSPSPDTSLALLAANNNYVAANVAHSLWDGRVLLDVVNSISQNIDIKPITTFSNSMDTFAKEIEETDSCPENELTNPNLTHFTSKDKFFKSQNNRPQYLYSLIPVSSLACYDSINKKPRGLTDAFYANICLACNAYEGKIDKFGIMTCVDIRKFIPHPYGFEQQNVFSYFDIIANNVTPQTTIREVMKQTRDCFNQRIKEKAHFGWLKHMYDEVDQKKNINKMRPLLSNFGIFELGGPIVDVFARDTTRYEEDGYKSVDFLSYGIRGNGRNDICNLLEYSQKDISCREANLLLSSVNYGLQNFDINTTCEEAINRLKEFQANYIKNEYPKFEYRQ